MIQNSHKGFTLIELLVVVAIIGILASVVLASLSTARAKGRDTRRKSDLHQIQNALYLYYNTNGQYPDTGASNNHRAYSCDNVSWNAFTTLLTGFISAPPVDPLNTGACNGSWTAVGNYQYVYIFSTVSDDYDLVAQLENTNDPSRAAIKCWVQHYAGGNIPWTAVAPCNGSNYAGGPYLYADH